jgi:AcrR family transcriptional regulator
MARPRAFDEGHVLDRATDVFWRLGYEGASMTELTKAMGINSPSIYVAFGSKRGLFDAVLQQYDQRREKYKAWTLAGQDAREVAERFLHGAVEWLTDANEPLGCLLVQSGLSTSPENADIPVMLAARRGRIAQMLADRFDAFKAEGALAQDADTAAMAGYVQTLFSGVAIEAAAGSPAKHLREFIDRAMASWPTVALSGAVTAQLA